MAGKEAHGVGGEDNKAGTSHDGDDEDDDEDMVEYLWIIRV